MTLISAFGRRVLCAFAASVLFASMAQAVEVKSASLELNSRKLHLSLYHQRLCTGTKLKLQVNCDSRLGNKGPILRVIPLSSNRTSSIKATRCSTAIAENRKLDISSYLPQIKTCKKTLRGSILVQGTKGKGQLLVSRQQIKQMDPQLYASSPDGVVDLISFPSSDKEPASDGSEGFRMGNSYVPGSQGDGIYMGLGKPEY